MRHFQGEKRIKKLAYLKITGASMRQTRTIKEDGDQS